MISEKKNSVCGRRTIVGLAALSLLFLPGFAYRQDDAAAAAKPNFSGRWRMIKDKSDFATFKMPDIIVRVVDHHDPTLNVHTVQTTGQKTSTADVSYFTDGSVTNNVISGRDAESKAFWDGRALVIRTDTKTSTGDDEVIEDRWELSEDGETLTTTSHVTTSKGEVRLKLVCAKEKVNGAGG
jgi:hypothetical protein